MSKDSENLLLEVSRPCETQPGAHRGISTPVIQPVGGAGNILYLVGNFLKSLINLG